MSKLPMAPSSYTKEITRKKVPDGALIHVGNDVLGRLPSGMHTREAGTKDQTRKSCKSQQTLKLNTSCESGSSES